MTLKRFGHLILLGAYCVPLILFSVVFFFTIAGKEYLYSFYFFASVFVMAVSLFYFYNQENKKLLGAIKKLFPFLFVYFLFFLFDDIILGFPALVVFLTLLHLYRKELKTNLVLLKNDLFFVVSAFSRALKTNLLKKLYLFLPVIVLYCLIIVELILRDNYYFVLVLTLSIPFIYYVLNKNERVERLLRVFLYLLFCILIINTVKLFYDYSFLFSYNDKLMDYFQIIKYMLPELTIFIYLGIIYLAIKNKKKELRISKVNLIN